MTTTPAQLIDAYRGRPPELVAYRPSTWIRVLNAVPVRPDILGVLTDDAYSRPSRTNALDRVVKRSGVDRLTSLIDLDDEETLLRAFLLVQAWGTGKSGNRTIRHTSSAFAHHEQLVTGLGQSTQALRIAAQIGEVARPYGDWSVPGVGRSFLTKWFAFAGQAPERDWQPLILDDRVLRTLNDTLRLSTKQLAGSSAWPDRYAAYVASVHQWADDGEVDAQWVEWVLFKQNGAETIPQT